MSHPGSSYMWLPYCFQEMLFPCSRLLLMTLTLSSSSFSMTSEPLEEVVQVIWFIYDWIFFHLFFSVPWPVEVSVLTIIFCKWLIRRNPAHCSSTLPGLVILGSVRKQAEHDMRSRQGSSTFPWLLYQFLPSGSFSVWVPVLTSLVMNNDIDA